VRVVAELEVEADVVRRCRVYRTDAGLSGRPDERWIRDAVSWASRSS
jgi:hypothetical protein